MTRSTQSSHIKVDMSYPSLMKKIQDLTKTQLRELQNTTVKLQKTTWQELWERKPQTVPPYDKILKDSHRLRETKAKKRQQ